AGKQVAFNQAIVPKASWKKTITDVGFVHLTCNIHKEMSAWLAVLPNVYFARPDPKTGAFEIPGIPAGKYKVRIWGEALTDEQKAPPSDAEARPAAQPLTVASR